jgi:hypothetical protein
MSRTVIVKRNTANNYVDYPHSGAVTHYSGYLEPRVGAVSVHLSSQHGTNVLHIGHTVWKMMSIPVGEEWWL